MLSMGSEEPAPPSVPRLRLLGPVIQMLTALILVWAGVRTAVVSSVPMGIFLIAVGGITAALAGRQLINRIRTPDSGFESSGELPKDAFDYIVWTAVGLPIVMVIGLLVFVLTTPR